MSHEMRDLLQTAYAELTELRAGSLVMLSDVLALANKVKAMASTHDQIKDILASTSADIAALSADADTVIAAKEQGDAANADLLTQATTLAGNVSALKTKLANAKAALADAEPAASSASDSASSASSSASSSVGASTLGAVS